MLRTDMGLGTEDEPRYRDALRVVGAYLDWLQASHVLVSETSEGFLWHCFPRGDIRKPYGGMMAYDRLPGLLHDLRSARREKRGGFSRKPRARYDAKRRRLESVCDDGYQEVFRTIGARLDQLNAMSVLIVEQNDKLTVGYQFPVPGYLRRDVLRVELSSGQHEDVYSRDQVATMVSVCRGNRNNPFFH